MDVYNQPGTASDVTIDYGQSGSEPSQINWDEDDVYHGTREWMRYINQHNHPGKDRYWNIFDIFNFPEISWWDLFFNSSATGEHSRKKLYKNGVKIFVHESNFDNRRYCDIGGIKANEKLLSISLWHKDRQNLGLVVVSFTNKNIYNEWYSYIFNK